MEDVVIATSEADARAADAVRAHHAELAGALALRVEALVAAATTGRDVDEQRARLVEWCETELLPHAGAEEQAMYPVAQGMPEGRLLIDGMLAEHQVITGLVAALRTAVDPVRATGAAQALRTMFESHLAKEDDLVMPLLVAAPDVSVAQLLGGMHELLGGHGADERHGGQSAGEGHGAHGGGVVPGEHGTDEDHGAHSEHSGYTCACGEHDEGMPVLDARVVPHAIRHATIFGALDAVRPGGGMVLLAPHDPKPLLAQVEQRTPGLFEVSYLERGPETWRLAFLRRASA